MLESENLKGLRDRVKSARLLRDLLSNGVHLAAIQDIHFVYDIVAHVLSNDIRVPIG